MDTRLIEAHNAEAQATWDAFDAGRALRPPVSLGTGTQYFIYNDDLNHGGPTIMLLHDGSPDDVRAEVQRILDSGVCAERGGRFVLREANNLAPRTPFANLAAMYETARAWRKFSD